MKKIYGSASAFMVGDNVYSPSSGGCFRKILLRSKGIDTQIDPKYAVIGALNEALFESELPPDVEFTRELPVRVEVIEGVQMSGRADFVLPGLIYELKSVSSPNVRREVIKNGHYKPDNLAQLANYMIHMGIPKGVLHYRFWDKDDNGEYTPHEERCFKVEFDDNKIMVDSVYSGYTIFDLLSHQIRAAEVVKDEIIAQRPHGYDSTWSSPCKFCVFKSTCDTYDKAALSKESFFESAQAAVTATQRKE